MIMHIHKKIDIHDTWLFLTFFSKVWNESVHSSHKAIVLEHNISHASEFNFLSEPKIWNENHYWQWFF